MVARMLARALDQTRSRFSLRRAAAMGARVRIFGRPSVACDGELRVGDDVVLLSRPSPIEIVVGPRGVLVIGNGAVLESGVVVRAQSRIVIGELVHIGAGCIVDDEGSEDGITIDRGTCLRDGTVVWNDPASGAGAPARGPAGEHPAEGYRSAPLPSVAHGDLDERVRQVIARILPAAGLAGSDESLNRIKQWDSLCALRIMVALEKEFRIVLSYDLVACEPRIGSLVTAIGAAASNAKSNDREARP